MTDWFLRLPEIASEHGARLDRVNSLVHLLMLVLFLVWGGLFVYMLIRFRAGRNPRANYHGLNSHLSNWGEGGVVLAEAVLLVGFSIPLYSERVDDLPPEGGDTTVLRVIGEQYAWNIHYPGPDGIFGRTDPALVDAGNPIGLDDDDPAAADDVRTINQLHVPVGKPVLIYLSSKDVIHSFWLPEMRVKQDAIPGLVFPVWFQPIATSGDTPFEIACAQLCGLGHYRMKGYFTVHTQEAFDAWMAEQQAYRAQEDEDDFWN